MKVWIRFAVVKFWGWSDPELNYLICFSDMSLF